MDEIKQKFPTLEEAFNNFVKEFGGELISERLPRNSANNPKNADYLFKKDNIVAELKCLQEDSYQSDEDMSRFFEKVEAKIRKGYLSEKDLNEEGWKEEIHSIVFADIKRPLEGIFRYAKKQIKTSKEYLNLPNAKGLLLVANDGNYFNQFSSDIFTLILRDFLFAATSEIDGFVLFLTNKIYIVDNKTENGLIWLVTTKDPDDQEFMNSCMNIGKRWGEFVGKKTGMKMGEGQMWDKSIVEKNRASLRLIPPKQ